jgi:hypothetical protein
MDQERADYADPPPPPSWFESFTAKGTLAVVCGAVLFAIARGLCLRYVTGP